MKHQYEDYIEWIDDERKFVALAIADLESNGDESEGLFKYDHSLLANRDTLERKPEVWLNGSDAEFHALTGRNQMLAEIQADTTKRLDEVMG